MRKIVVSGLVVSFLIISCFGNIQAAPRKHGVELIVVKMDGKVVRGELIAVKPSSILTMEDSSDEAIDIKDIKLIKVVSKEELLRGKGIGFIIGSVSGALLGAASGSSGGTVIGATSVFGGIIGEFVLGLIGTNAGVVETIQIEGKSPEEVKEALGKLNRLARIPQKIS